MLKSTTGAGPVSGEQVLADGVDLRAVETGAGERELVRRQVDRVRVRADVRIVAEAVAAVAVMVRRALRAVVLHRQ